MSHCFFLSIGNYIIVLFLYIYTPDTYSFDPAPYCSNCCSFITFLILLSATWFIAVSFKMFLKMLLTHNLFTYFKMSRKSKTCLNYCLKTHYFVKYSCAFMKAGASFCFNSNDNYIVLTRKPNSRWTHRNSGNSHPWFRNLTLLVRWVPRASWFTFKSLSLSISKK